MTPSWLASTWQEDVTPPTDWSPPAPASLGCSTETCSAGEPVAPATGASFTPAPERLLEAILFVAREPVSHLDASRALRGLTVDQFHALIEGLNQAYRRQGRPYFIVRHESGYRLALRPKFRGLLDKLYGGVKEARLTPAAVETLAIVAFRQPITKADVDSLRGQESGPLLRQLTKRGLIVPRRADPPTDTGAWLYETTPRFLELFHLSTLADLPRVEDLDRL
jgi:segregation and condensation protein B